jgi:M6 family metalloprotease-like protein/MYXO-CTERM domain-containing protein
VYEGELRAFAVDHEDGSHHVGYALRAIDGRTYELAVDGEPSARPGDHVIVHGAPAEGVEASGVGDVLAVESIETLVSSEEIGGATAALTGLSPRTVRVAILPLVFPGTKAHIDVATAAQRLQTVHDYYEEISYGGWDVQGDALNPINLPQPANCNLDTIANAGRAAAQSQGVDLSVYDHVAFVIPEGTSLANCACGLAWVGRSPAMGNPSIGDSSLYTCTDENAFAHEMGHGFGLNHASTARCGVGVPYRRDPYTSCDPDEYGNRFNTMGGGLGHMNAFQKSTMGWLGHCNDARVTRDGDFELVPIQVASDELQALQIPTGDSVNGEPLYFWVEYRNPNLSTFNSQTEAYPETKTGLHIDVARDYRASGGDSRPLLLDLAEGYPNNFHDPRLTTGRSFTDPDGRVTITLVEENGARAVVRVTFPNGGSGTNTCGDGSSLPDDDAVLVDPPASLVKLVVRHSGKCLGAASTSPTNATNVEQWGCESENARVFHLEPTSPEGYELIDVESGLCVDIDHSGLVDGTNVQLWECNGSTAQAFRLEATSDGYFHLTNLNSRRCVDVFDYGEDDASNIVQWVCGSGTNQEWTFDAISDEGGGDVDGGVPTDPEPDGGTSTPGGGAGGGSGGTGDGSGHGGGDPDPNDGGDMSLHGGGCSVGGATGGGEGALALLGLVGMLLARRRRY